MLCVHAASQQGRTLPSVALFPHVAQWVPSFYLGCSSGGVRSEPCIASAVLLEPGLSLAISCFFIDELGDNESQLRKPCYPVSTVWGK